MNQSEGYEEAKHRIQEALENNATYLYLDGLRLSDLPPEIAELNSLIFLSLEFNDFRTLPIVLRKLSHLEVIYMEKNPLNTLPEWIGEFTRLEGLNFYECDLQEIPETIGNLIMLDHFDLSGNKLTNLPDSIGQLNKLDSLGLSDNKLLSLPETMGDLVNLIDLSLGLNQLTELPKSMMKLKKLEYLDVHANQITMLPDGIKNLTKLEGLNLAYNQIDELPKLQNLKNLDFISLDSNPIAELPSQLPTLKTLDISRCPNIRQLPSDLKVTDEIRMSHMRFDAIPLGCQTAKIIMSSREVQHQWITNPEMITMSDVLSAKDKWERENLMNLMGYQRLLSKIEFVGVDTFEDNELSAKLIKLELSESEKYLIIFDKSSLKYGVDWLPDKIHNCQDALKRYEHYSSMPWSYKNFV